MDGSCLLVKIVSNPTKSQLVCQTRPRRPRIELREHPIRETWVHHLEQARPHHQSRHSQVVDMCPAQLDTRTIF